MGAASSLAPEQGEGTGGQGLFFGSRAVLFFYRDPTVTGMITVG